jgi:hypothetical protein
MTIEEAWEALNYVGAQKEERATVKALALAVLEEVESYAYRHNCHDPEGLSAELYEQIKLPALRRRIQELGK